MTVTIGRGNPVLVKGTGTEAKIGTVLPLRLCGAARSRKHGFSGLIIGCRLQLAASVRRGDALKPSSTERWTDGSAVRLRVERQTHLPADRVEAWKALESLADARQWNESAAVFTALEAIYSFECQKLGANLQKAFRAANEALEQIQLEPLENVEKLNASLRFPTEDAFAHDLGAAGTSSNHESSHQNNKTDSNQQQSAIHDSVHQSIDVDQDQSVDESDILAFQSVDFESASRLEYDRQRRQKIDLNSMKESGLADKEFVDVLFTLLRKAHFVHLSARDEALAKSLNSDYVAQIFISPDTRHLDPKLFSAGLEPLDVPEQARSMLVFKRGYGQARRKGRMLVAKLDYLQYVVVRSFVSNLAGQSRKLWQALVARLSARHEGKAESDPDKNLTSLERFDEGIWTSLQQAVRGAAKRLRRSGVLSPRLLLAGGGLFMTLSNWGLLPQVDVEPLGRFQDALKPNEPNRLTPVNVERVSLRDAVAARKGLSFENVLGKIELIEPTFQELLVIYRQEMQPEWFAALRSRLTGPSEKEQSPRYRRRNIINMRIYRDVPMPIWKLVYPDKLLQFRPLDGLRADLLTVAGLVAFIAQAKYDSVILELITLSSAVVLLVRVVLGYKRMNDRFDKMANEMLADTTIAGQEGVVEYIAGSAALQQFEQTSLAYLILLKSGRQPNAEALCSAVENTLESQFQVKIRFDANEAVAELARLGLAQHNSDGITACKPSQGLAKLTEHWIRLLSPATSMQCQEL